MNEKLKEELERYFYSDDYNLAEDTEEVKAAYETYHKELEAVVKQDKGLFCSLENLIGSSEVAYEKRGFLNGYAYCLTMMGLGR